MEDIPAEFSEESGLHVLENGTESSTVDIIAVHGLAANPVYTWVKKVPNNTVEIGRLNKETGFREVLWLKHLLPSKVPVARILKYNYASAYLTDAPTESLRSIASRLVNNIHCLRKNELVKRPIIFIGHSFGGIVIADALVYAYRHVDPTYKEIALSTCGAVFLGTPFRGSKASSWGIALTNCGAILGLGSNNRLLKTLSEDSEVIERLLDDFTITAQELSMKLICFYETKQTKLGKLGKFGTLEIGLTTFVVDKSSATIDGHSSRSLASDHSAMNKFGSRTDENFILVSGALEELVTWSYTFSLPKSRTLNNDLTLHQDLPSASRNFTGREDYLNKMRKYFDVDNLQPNGENQKNSLKVFVLYGLGGSGKTQLALKFAELYCDRFAEIFFINASGTEVLESKLASIAKQFHIGDTVQQALQWLDFRSQQRSLLLIYDNANDPSLDLRNYFPKTGNLIITTQNRNCRVYAPQGNINVAALPTQDAIDLLLKASMLDQQCDSLDKQYTIELVQELSCLPLAITQAGAYIRQTSNFDEYLHFFKKHRNQILRHPNSNAQDQDYLSPVYTTWDLSYQKLDNAAKYLLKIYAFLHYEGIPKSLFEKGVVQLLKGESEVPYKLKQHEHFLKSYWTTDNEWDALKFNNTLTQLTLYSLIDITNELQNLYSMHSLVQFWVRDSLEDEERAVIHTISRMLVCLSATYKRSTQDYVYRRQLIPHLLVLSDMDDISPVEASNAALVYLDNAQFSKAERLFLQVWKELERNLGEEHPRTLTSMDNVVLLYLHQGKFEEAEKLHKQILEARKIILGEERLDTLQSMKNSAFIYLKQDKLKQAKKWLKQIIEVQKKLLGEQHPDTLSSMNSLAVVYWRQRKWRKAENLHKQVLETKKNTLTEDHPDILRSMNGIAVLYMIQGRWEQAKKLFEQTLEARKKILGEAHPYTLGTMNTIALLYLRLFKWEHAEKLLRHVLEMRTKIFGEEHADTLAAMDCLVIVHFIQFRWIQCEQILGQILEIRKKLLGEEHPQTRTTKRDLQAGYHFLNIDFTSLKKLKHRDAAMEVASD